MNTATRRRWIAAALPLAAAAGGCMVGPDYAPPADKTAPGFTEVQPPATTRPVSTVVARDVSVTEWWTTFRDPELEKLVARAAKGNLNLLSAASRVRQARAQRGITGTGLFPTLDVKPGYQRSRGSQNVSLSQAFAQTGSGGGTKSAAGLRPADVASPVYNPPAGGPPSPLGSGGLPGYNEDLYEVGFDSTWEVDVFGGQRRQVESAIDLIQFAQEDQRDMLVSAEAEVARNYIDLRGLQRQLQIAKQNLAAQQDILDLTTSRYKAGFVTDLDVARQSTQVSTTAAALPALDAQIRVTIHTIGVLLGEDPNTLMSELLTDGPIPPVPPEIPSACPATCSAAGPTSAGPSGTWPARPPTSASPSPICTPSSRSPPPSGSTRTSPSIWPTGTASTGPSPPASAGRSSTAAASTSTSTPRRRPPGRP